MKAFTKRILLIDTFTYFFRFKLRNHRKSTSQKCFPRKRKETILLEYGTKNRKGESCTSQIEL